VAVACPFCTIMIEDGLKEANQEDRVKVLELSEVLARSLPAPN
jgi:Fe-S oxidoreductase